MIRVKVTLGIPFIVIVSACAPLKVSVKDFDCPVYVGPVRTLPVQTQPTRVTESGDFEIPVTREETATVVRGQVTSASGHSDASRKLEFQLKKKRGHQRSSRPRIDAFTASSYFFMFAVVISTGINVVASGKMVEVELRQTPPGPPPARPASMPAMESGY